MIYLKTTWEELRAVLASSRTAAEARHGHGAWDVPDVVGVLEQQSVTVIVGDVAPRLSASERAAVNEWFGAGFEVTVARPRTLPNPLPTSVPPGPGPDADGRMRLWIVRNEREAAWMRRSTRDGRRVVAPGARLVGLEFDEVVVVGELDAAGELWLDDNVRPRMRAHGEIRRVSGVEECL